MINSPRFSFAQFYLLLKQMKCFECYTKPLQLEISDYKDKSIYCKSIFKPSTLFQIPNDKLLLLNERVLIFQGQFGSTRVKSFKTRRKCPETHSN